MSSTGRRDASTRGRTPRVAGRRVAGRPTSRPRPAPHVDPAPGAAPDTPDAVGVEEVDETTAAGYTAVDEPDEAPEADSGDLDDRDGGDPDDPDDADTPAFSTRLSIVLLVAALLVAAGGLFLWLRAERIDDAAGSNLAVVDAGQTVAVTTAVREALEQVFSYRYDNTALTEAAAKTVLVGEASGQYEELFKQVRELAPEQKLVHKSKVVLSGVSQLDGDHATMLVFLDQTSTRGDNGESTVGGAQLTVDAQRVDGVWRISAMKIR
ncbi:nuclear transport factor 2 family protein [Actinokineospora sp. PR83]|uniref:nuclear transport factor 2 family protein n=1 Tax=Actinokineospora sp. PR83 TaxID=2884908 RepID=UPI001F40942C|nr:nuclear transport factor 2 family protein [Actinokineospora sp. PR83]MCG8919357.1 nuclear transport factor 2 family protein [Actinokineospora sp. PR83]